MSINVPDGELEAFAREKVARGEYESIGHVICEGLRLLKRQDELWKGTASAKIEEGLTQLQEGKTIPGHNVISEVRERIRSNGGGKGAEEGADE